MRILGILMIHVVAVGLMGCGSPDGVDEFGQAGKVYSSQRASGTLESSAKATSVYGLDGNEYRLTNVPPVVTSAILAQLKTGLTYAETVKLIGAEPVYIVQEENPFSNARLTTAQWINGDLSQVTIMFADDKLHTISQIPAP